MDSQPTVACRRVRFLDLVALVTTACLVSLVVFLQIKVLPFYIAVLVEGGYPLPFPLKAANWICNFTTRYLLVVGILWALYALWRSVRSARPLALPKPRALAVANLVAVVVLMGQVSGFVGFAMHGLKAAHNVITAQEQSRAEHAAGPSR